MRIALLAALAPVLLGGCASPTTPDRFQPSDFFGEWRVQADATACWEPLDMLFTIDAASIEREGPGSMNFSSRWGSPSEATRTRLVSGYVYWNEPEFQTFQITFYRAGEFLAELVAERPVVSADRLEGIFFDPNRASCRTTAAALKVGP
jgi:hypothetical protein